MLGNVERKRRREQWAARGVDSVALAMCVPLENWKKHYVITKSQQ